MKGVRKTQYVIERKVTITRDGVETWVLLEIDTAWLVQQLGGRAIESKGKRSQALAGAVVVSVTAPPGGK